MHDPGTESKTHRIALDEHLAAMEAAACQIEDILGRWAQEWCQSTVDKALERDRYHTNSLKAGDKYGKLMKEAAQLNAELPELLRLGLRTSVWRHQFVDAGRTGTARIMSELDFGIWQHDGYKIPAAYGVPVGTVTTRVTRLLRKYGYRPEFGSIASNYGQSTPPRAIEPMLTYHRLSVHLAEVVVAAEEARGRGGSAASWDGP
jgi:hypothetical protein